MLRFVKPQKDPKKALIIILIGGVMMVALDYANTALNKNSLIENSALVEIGQGMDSFNLDSSEIKDFKSAQDIVAKMKPAEELTQDVFFNSEQVEKVEDKKILSEEADNYLDAPAISEQQKAAAVAPLQKWKEHAVKLQAPAGGAKIAIIIDDMGMDYKRSHRVIDMKGPLTLAFLPYAPNLGEITGKASAAGHELLIHAPMEPLNEELNPGPIALLDSMDEVELSETLDKMFSSFEGYVGINNHMGSKVTQNEHILRQVMSSLADKGLIFVDSKTIHTSLAGKVASEFGLDYAERDVFLDHEPSLEFVMNALLRTEEIAMRRGVAIAIGHPRDFTIQALEKWLPDAEKRGFTIIPISAAVQYKESERLLVSKPSNPSKLAPSLLPAQLPAQPPE